ncbi:MAG: hypothetical protein M3541_10795 [Acidobacteriota bacterium]|jgi:hypothetical protein|nr:hypothetical protein [Acidobacteriota bacterium]
MRRLLHATSPARDATTVQNNGFDHGKMRYGYAALRVLRDGESHRLRRFDAEADHQSTDDRSRQPVSRGGA